MAVLQILGELLENLLQVPALLTGGHGGAVHLGKGPGKFGQGGGQAVSFQDPGPHGHHNALDPRASGLLHHGGQRLLHGQTGTDQGGQLPGHQRLFAGIELAAA